MDIKILKSFQTIVQLGSFIKAAEHLQYAQSTITLQIQKLEQDLGVALFVRDGKRIRLTEAGRILSAQTAGLLKTVEDLRQSMINVEKGLSGHIRIAAIEPSASVRLPAIIAEFCKKRPGIQLTFEVGSTNNIAEQVASNEFDFGICAPTSMQPGLTFEPLFKEPFVLLISTDNKLSQKEFISVEDLSNEQILLKEKTCHYRTMIELKLMAHGYNPYTGMEIGSFEAIKRMVQHNLGVSLIPKTILTEMPEGTVYRNINGTVLELSIGAIYNPEITMSSAAQSLLTHFRQGLADSMDYDRYL